MPTTAGTCPTGTVVGMTTSAPQPDHHDLDETAVIARDLIRFDTSNYGGGRSEGEADAAEYVAEALRASTSSRSCSSPSPVA
jgi:acetylornithine deacetylase/succinyl-diaminopimelate desuccinylase-like protein